MTAGSRFRDRGADQRDLRPAHVLHRHPVLDGPRSGSGGAERGVQRALRRLVGGDHRRRAGRAAAPHVRRAPPAGAVPHVQERVPTPQTEGQDQVIPPLPQLRQGDAHQEPQETTQRRQDAQREPPPRGHLGTPKRGGGHGAPPPFVLSPAPALGRGVPVLSRPTPPPRSLAALSPSCPHSPIPKCVPVPLSVPVPVPVSPCLHIPVLVPVSPSPCSHVPVSPSSHPRPFPRVHPPPCMSPPTWPSAASCRSSRSRCGRCRRCWPTAPRPAPRWVWGSPGGFGGPREGVWGVLKGSQPPLTPLLLSPRPPQGVDLDKWVGVTVVQ
ncbi:uncharacterized protein LOC141935953 [Strix uralensis]|uniref:uncharacterized protein LOC141935953 n=1 Tax=Strix uralensis TaxID=36305 RepID=UPI003DA6D2CD